MASLRQKGSQGGEATWVLCFRVGKAQFNRDVGQDEDLAKATRRRVEAFLLELNRGRRKIPEGLAREQVGTWVLSDGQLTEAPTLPALPVETKPKLKTLGELLEEYGQSMLARRKADTTQMTEEVHLGHFRRLLDLTGPVERLTNADLQRYVASRGKEKGIRGRKVQTQTIGKEIDTLAVIWDNFARPAKVVRAYFRDQIGGLVFPKQRAKPPFKTFAQIQRQVGRGGLTEAEVLDLWDSLYLDQGQVKEVLALVGAAAGTPPWLHPMVAFAAHTGARRSEMMRSEIDDWDFDGGVVHVREKKKDKDREFTFRDVPLTPRLAEVMRGWFMRHPGGRYTLCEEAGKPLSPKAVVYNYEKVLAGTKWEVCRGWHIFRHSMASILASQGVDQRVIDDVLGHQTEEMRKRYRHLFPAKKQQVLALMFD